MIIGPPVTGLDVRQVDLVFCQVLGIEGGPSPGERVPGFWPEWPAVCGYGDGRDWTLCASAGAVRGVARAQADGGDRVLPR